MNYLQLDKIKCSFACEKYLHLETCVRGHSRSLEMT